MKIYKITAYLYLAFAFVFLYSIYEKVQNGENYIIDIFFVVLAVFMFFFRMRSAKKDQTNQNNNTKI